MNAYQRNEAERGPGGAAAVLPGERPCEPGGFGCATDSAARYALVFGNEVAGVRQDVVDAAAAFIAKYAGVPKLSALPCFDAAMVDRIASDAVKNPMKLASAPRSVAPEKAAEIISGILKQEL